MNRGRVLSERGMRLSRGNSSTSGTAAHSDTEENQTTVYRWLSPDGRLANRGSNRHLQPWPLYRRGIDSVLAVSDIRLTFRQKLVQHPPPIRKLCECNAPGTSAHAPSLLRPSYRSVNV